MSPRRQLGLGLVALILLANGLLGVRWVGSGSSSRSSETPVAEPTASQLARARAVAPAPTFWFGSVGNGSQLTQLESASRLVSFSYGRRCVQTDSAEDCTEKASVRNEPRSASARWLSRRASCWKPYNRAWVLACDEPFRLYTAQRVISFHWQDVGNKPYSIPWQEAMSRLRRFDASAPIPATTRFTCHELRHLSNTHKAAIPAPIRPTGDCLN